jgi:hypothetical protein
MSALQLKHSTYTSRVEIVRDIINAQALLHRKVLPVLNKGHIFQFVSSMLSHCIHLRDLDLHISST